MGGKGDLIKVIPRSRYVAAVDRFHRLSELPPMTDGDEDEPTRGVVRGGKDGMRKHMQGGRDAATRSVAVAEQPYGSTMGKCITLATMMNEIETPAPCRRRSRRRSPKFWIPNTPTSSRIRTATA